MPTVYLEPDDVPAFEAGRVLAALNAAPDAEFLATAIEFPNEPDIGVRLGQRLLDRRDELGGFATLRQVADVPLIGPERFTEIVVGLSGRPALDYLDVRPAAPAGWTDARGELGLRLMTGGPWLGQLTSVVATATVDGRRRAGIEVVLAAGSGRLRAVSGGRVLGGATITVVTGSDGVSRATWVTDARPVLDPAAAAALSDALAVLPETGATPAGASAGLAALVTAYRWEPNEPLRRAVDALVDAEVAELVDVDLGADWPTVETTLTAWTLAGADRPGGAADAVAVQPLVARDWRPAFVRTYHDALAGQARLAGHLETDQRESHDATDLVGRVQKRVGAFLDVQQGRLGTSVARAIAADTSRAFVVDRTGDLDLDDALQVAPILGATAQVAGTATPSVVRAVAATRSTVLQRVDQTVGSELPPIVSRLDVLDGTLAGKVDQAGLEQAVAGKLDRSELDDALADKLDRTELDDALAGAITRDEFEVAMSNVLDRSALDVAVSRLVGRDELEAAVADKLDRSALDQALSNTVSKDQLAQALGGKLGRAELDEVLGGLVKREEFEEVLQSRVSLDEFRSFARDTEARLRRLEG